VEYGDQTIRRHGTVLRTPRLVSCRLERNRIEHHLTIGKILKITPEQTHALVVGMMFGRKAALLRSLLPKSDYKNISELKGFLTHIKKLGLRNVFTHSLIFSSPDDVTFVHRSSQDDYSAKGYSFKADDFCGHVN
jgi:hypothetical protein